MDEIELIRKALEKLRAEEKDFTPAVLQEQEPKLKDIPCKRINQHLYLLWEQEEIYEDALGTDCSKSWTFGRKPKKWLGRNQIRR